MQLLFRLVVYFPSVVHHYLKMTNGTCNYSFAYFGDQKHWENQMDSDDVEGMSATCCYRAHARLLRFSCFLPSIDCTVTYSAEGNTGDRGHRIGVDNDIRQWLVLESALISCLKVAPWTRKELGQVWVDW